MKKTLFLIILLMLSSVSSIGISYPNNEIIFQPNLVKNLEFDIINIKEGTFVNYSLSGEFAKYSQLNVIDNDTVSVLFQFPDKLSPPGYSNVFFEAKEIPISREGIFLATATNVGIKIFIPFSGPYLEADFKFQELIMGKNNGLLIELWNKGEEFLDDISGNILIYHDKKLMSDIKIGPYYLNSGDKYNLYFDLDIKELGEYEIFANILYADKSFSDSMKFSFFESNLKFESFSGELLSGEISPYKIRLKNNGNKEIKEVYSEIKMYDSNKNILESSVTNRIKIGAREEEDILGFIDLSNVESGKYFLVIEIFYEDISFKNGQIIFVDSKGFNLLFLFIIPLLCFLVYLYRLKRRRNYVN